MPTSAGSSVTAHRKTSRSVRPGYGHLGGAAVGTVTKSGDLGCGASLNSEAAQNRLTVTRQSQAVSPYQAGPATPPTSSLGERVAMEPTGTLQQPTQSPTTPGPTQPRHALLHSTRATTHADQTKSASLQPTHINGTPPHFTTQHRYTPPLESLAMGSTCLTRTRVRALSDANGSPSRRSTEFGTGGTSSRPQALGVEENDAHGVHVASVEAEVALLERDMVCMFGGGFWGGKLNG